MLKKDVRRHQRIPFPGPLRISWEDEHGVSKYAQGKCLDVSEGGLGIEIEVFEPIPVRSRVSIRADRINFHGSGAVKHIARRGGKYILGLELSQTLSGQAFGLSRTP